MPRDDAAWLMDMLLACQKVARYTDGMSFTQFTRDERTQDAVFRSLEIIGEAARNVSAVTQSQCRDVPWTQIISFRNRLIHGYFEINLEVVWQIATTDVEPLAQQLSEVVSWRRGDQASDNTGSPG